MQRHVRRSVQRGALRLVEPQRGLVVRREQHVAGPGSTNFPNSELHRRTGDSGHPRGDSGDAVRHRVHRGRVRDARQSDSRPSATCRTAQQQEGRDLRQTRPNTARIVNALKSLTASSIIYGEGSDGNPLGTSTPWCILYIDPSNFVTPAGEGVSDRRRQLPALLRPEQRRARLG